MGILWTRCHMIKRKDEVQTYGSKNPIQPSLILNGEKKNGLQTSLHYGSIPYFHERKQQLSNMRHYFYFLEHENDNGWCFKQEMSNNSMNLWSDTRALAAANL